jgi:hypothetical protein
VAIVELSVVEDGVHASVLLLDFDVFVLSDGASEVELANSVATLAVDLAALNHQVHLHGELFSVLFEITNPHAVSVTWQHLLLLLLLLLREAHLLLVLRRVLSRHALGRVLARHALRRVLSRHTLGRVLARHALGRILSGHTLGRVLSGHALGRILSGLSLRRVLSRHALGRILSRQSLGRVLSRHALGRRILSRLTLRRVLSGHTIRRVLSSHALRRVLSGHSLSRHLLLLLGRVLSGHALGRELCGHSLPRHLLLHRGLHHGLVRVPHGSAGLAFNGHENGSIGVDDGGRAHSKHISGDGHELLAAGVPFTLQVEAAAFLTVVLNREPLVEAAGDSQRA